MSEKCFEGSSLLSCVLLVLSIIQGAMLSAEEVSIPEATTPIHLGETLRSPGEPWPVRFFELEVPGEGLVSIDVLAPGYEAAAPFLHLPEAAGAEAGLELWHRSPSRLVLIALGPQTLRFGLSAQDDRQPLGPFQLRTGFATPAKDECDPAGEDCEEIEIETNPLADEGDIGWCPLEPPDDHGDTLGCATWLDLDEKVVVASLANGWGDDSDVYGIVLPKSENLGPFALHTLQVETRGELDTFGCLYDARGLAMGCDDDRGTGNGFRLVRSLPPGAYYVRVQGRGGAEGAYVLTLEVDRP